MDIVLAMLAIITLSITGSIAQDDNCPVRNSSLTNCERSCSVTSPCRKAGRQCECAGECGWSCIRQGCTTLSAPENGDVTINPANRTIGSVATFTCHDGYSLQGMSARVCLQDKTWNDGTAVSCTDGCVRNTDEVRNRLGWSCARECNSDSTCLRSRYECRCDNVCGMSCILDQENYCDSSLLSTSHATFTVEPPTAVFGSIARYTCVDGFIPVGGDIQRTCTGGNSWSGSPLICDPEHACYNPPAVENASHNGSKEYYLEGELLLYKCNPGYHRRDSIPLLICRRTGDTVAWGHFDMTCLPKSCEPPGDISNGRREGNVFSFLSSVTYVCNDGYKIQGIATRHCQSDQQWSPTTLPRCIPIECRSQSAPENGAIDGSGRGYNDEVSFSCNNGFILDGESTLRCQNDETWSSPTPTCKAISEVCVMRQDPTNGQWVKGSKCREGQYQLEGCELSYTCNEGYNPANTGVVYVCSEPEWNQIGEPVCTAVIVPGACDNFNLPQDNLLPYQKDEPREYTPDGEYLEVKCERNFYLKNGPNLWCVSGVWKGKAFCSETDF